MSTRHRLLSIVEHKTLTTLLFFLLLLVVPILCYLRVPFWYMISSNVILPQLILLYEVPIS